MKTFNTRISGDGWSIWHRHTEEETKIAWSKRQQQGNKQAREKGSWCIIVRCDEEGAIMMSQMFHELFAIESCCYYGKEEKELSMYCGDAGSGANKLVKKVMEEIARPYERGRKEIL